MRVALATSEKWPQLSPDEQSLGDELTRVGIFAEAAVWSDPDVAWSEFDLVVIRSCWDYHLRLDEFLEWLDQLEEEGVPVENEPSVVRWNAHKSYLLDLERQGVPIPATLLLRQGSKVPHPEAAKLVVKPAVSASAYETHLVNAMQAPQLLERLLGRGDVIVQEYVHEVASEGEWSLVYFDRVLSHAVKKAPKSGDFRVQEEHGGSSEPGEPPAPVLLVAEKALAAVDDDLLYARVDVVERASGSLLMELELIEPSLFFRMDPLAAKRFADAVRTWLTA
ncbi:MAG TPA: hypothetical protein VF057_03225 [Thermoanaerobaculia bacterium]